MLSALLLPLGCQLSGTFGCDCRGSLCLDRACPQLVECCCARIFMGVALLCEEQGAEAQTDEDEGAWRHAKSLQHLWCG